MSLARLIILLVAFAVPFQGVAAVAMGQCNAMGTDAGHDQHDQKAHDHAKDHDHAADHGSDVNSQSEDGDGSRCGPCSACCGSASLSGPAGFLIAPAFSSPPYAAHDVAPHGVMLRGFDRPPAAL